MAKLFEPVQIIWHVNNTCNAACKYCFASSRFSEQEINNKTWCVTVNQINKEESIKRVSIIGGEPLLVKELPQIIQHLRKDIVINVDSNLTTIKEKWDSVFERVLFSTTIDSLDEEVNFKTRGHSSKKTIEGIDFLINKGLKVQVILVATKYNIDTLEKAARYFLDQGVERIGISRVRMVGKAWTFGYKYFYNEIEGIKEKTVRIVKNLINSYGIQRILVYNLWHDKRFFDLGYRYEPSCKCALFRACVDWAGFIYPCELMPFYWKEFERAYKVKRPNLKKTTISDAFNSKLFKFFRAGMHYYPVNCQVCDFKKNCNHGCRFYAFLTSTVLLAKDITCGVDSVYDVLGYHYYSPLSEIGEKRWQSAMAKFLKNISNILGEKIYDLGCGGGIWSFYLENLGKEMIGIDNNKTMMLIAEEYKNLHFKESKFVFADFLNYNFKKADSAILLDNTIAHLSTQDFRRLLDRLKYKVNLFLIEINKNKPKKGILTYKFGLFDIEEKIGKGKKILKRRLLNKQTGAEIGTSTYNWIVSEVKNILEDYGKIIIKKDINNSKIFLLRFEKGRG